jgi:transcriptional regulator of acetoin/glycerol metabolism
MVAKQARRLEQQEILNRLASMEQALAESWRRSQEQYNEDREQFLGIIKSKLEVGDLRAQRGANTSSGGGLGNRSRPAS